MYDIRLYVDAMPTVNVSNEGMERIERIKEESRWNPSNREVVDKALEHLENEELDVQTESQNTAGGN